MDALFGTGLSRELSSEIIKFIERANNSLVDIYAIDIPSGINGNTSEILGNSFICKKTITFFISIVQQVHQCSVVPPCAGTASRCRSAPSSAGGQASSRSR